MFLKKISLLNFKNIEQAELALCRGVNCLVGDNGAGKTNVIDAVYYLSMCKSSLPMTDGQSIRHGADFFLAEGQYLTDGGKSENIVCSFSRKGGKVLKRNGKEYERLSDHVGLVPAVIVSPADSALISDAADERRRYLNAFISQLDRSYLAAVMRYNAVLAERNRLLKNMPDETMLQIYDMQLVEQGERIHARRREFAERLQPVAAEYYRILSGDREQVGLHYRSELNERPFGEILLTARQKDLANEFTTAGIHRDDLVLRIGGYPLRKYGSQGQQKSFLIALKLAQYAIQGVEFTYLRVADIAMNNELVNGQRQVGVLYGFAEDTILQAIGLTTADAYKSESGIRYYTSDKLNKAMSDALTANATTVKNALEAAVRNGGKAMPETDENGHSKVSGLEQGLYLVVETRVPENVTSTCNPFFVSLPMTTIDGKGWNYDVTVYPKNQTGSPNLEKTVREDKNSTGKNTGSLTDIADGYAHTATASVDYQIISTLPTITSKATSLTTYTFVDTLSKGICYNKNDVVIEFFRDAGCTDKITTWDEDSGKFAVIYDDAANTMTIGMTEAGLAEINGSESVYTDSVKRGYSDCTMRITYAAALTADAQLGDSDNPNEVELTWKRTNTGYYDTLEDCCHVYTYGVDVLKQFSDGKGDLANVHFLLHNDTDGYFVTAKLVDGVYHVTGHEVKESKATLFVPNGEGHIRVMGLEDDTYTLTETDTDMGYVLLKDGIEIVITAAEGESACETCGAKLLTASGSVNGDAVDMESGNAIVPLTVINNPGFDLPKTGGYGTWMFTVGGCMLLGVAVFIVVRGRKHNRNDQ